MFYRKKQRMNVIQSNKEQAVSSRTFLKSEINNISQKIIVIKDTQTDEKIIVTLLQRVTTTMISWKVMFIIVQKNLKRMWILMK